jgi:TetR/AcrR family transcriptional regulator, transcriptional repressor of aconitase
MLISRLSDRAEQRRHAIVAAARTCFLRYGYGKASLNDIANEARISRPLLYLAYKNKEDIFKAVFAALFESRYPAVERMLAGRMADRQKLFGICETLVLEPWEELFGMPASEGFFETCERVLPLATAAYARRRLRYAQALLRRRELAEVFLLAVDGLTKDQPRTAVLRKRLETLVDCFASTQLQPEK